MEILCEISVRHVHLSKGDVELLFGKGAELEFERALSQPGQFLSKQRVTLFGPKREILNVAVLGPTRASTQIEISRTDSYMLGLKDAPVRQSGDLKGAPLATVKGLCGEAKGAVIVAKRHVHLDPETARKGGFSDGEIVRLRFDGERGGILDETVVRVTETSAPAVHLDSDEGNAVFAGSKVTVQKK